MRITTLALLAILAALPGSAAAAADAYSELPPGRYSVSVTGLMSTVCARAIETEWKKIPEVKDASVDFDRETAVVTVRLDKTLMVSVLRKTLKRAEKLANLGARYDIRDIKYLR
ncbi:MAG: hypothetical protein A2506_08595 [Elusimicrobia bacterium RIFOXYD12_FULL_66_9]|nr:MAG: hypothetical protein A2506_08595 [Elusimicrobia bacterium RIFOXYD12_FULL_66_9]